jgi:hypothetical protein
MQEARGDATVLRELGELYIPANERDLRRVQRKGDELDRHVRNWAQSVTHILPRGLPLNPDETLIFSLYLAQQRRLNLQMDANQPEAGFWASFKRTLPIPVAPPDVETQRNVHRLLAARLDSDIDRAATFFCTDNRVPADSEPAIDWRVAICFMAQSVYSRVATVDPRKIPAHPRRFELALVARDLAGDVITKRHRMFQLFADHRMPA